MVAYFKNVLGSIRGTWSKELILLKFPDSAVSISSKSLLSTSTLICVWIGILKFSCALNEIYKVIEDGLFLKFFGLCCFLASCICLANLFLISTNCFLFASNAFYSIGWRICDIWTYRFHFYQLFMKKLVYFRMPWVMPIVSYKTL